MNDEDLPCKAVVHDGNGTWFAARDLRVVLLTAAQARDLEAGAENMLADAYGGATLDVLLHEVVQDPTIEWEWNGDK